MGWPGRGRFTAAESGDLPSKRTAQHPKNSYTNLPTSLPCSLQALAPFHTHTKIAEQPARTPPSQNALSRRRDAKIPPVIAGGLLPQTKVHFHPVSTAREEAVRRTKLILGLPPPLSTASTARNTANPGAHSVSSCFPAASRPPLTN